MRRPHLKPIRKRILRERGIVGVKPPSRKHKHYSQTPVRIAKKHKSWAMLALERQYNLPIEEILTAGSLRYIEKRFGIDHSTAGKWRKRFGISQQGVGDD